MSGHQLLVWVKASGSVDVTERSLMCRGTLTDNIPYPTYQSHVRSDLFMIIKLSGRKIMQSHWIKSNKYMTNYMDKEIGILPFVWSKTNWAIVHQLCCSTNILSNNLYLYSKTKPSVLKSLCSPSISIKVETKLENKLIGAKPLKSNWKANQDLL